MFLPDQYVSWVNHSNLICTQAYTNLELLWQYRYDAHIFCEWTEISNRKQWKTKTKRSFGKGLKYGRLNRRSTYCAIELITYYHKKKQLFFTQIWEIKGDPYDKNCEVKKKRMQFIYFKKFYFLNRLLSITQTLSWF